MFLYLSQTPLEIEVLFFRSEAGSVVDLMSVV